MKSKGGGGFGLVLLLVVMAFVLYLFARDTKSVAPVLKDLREVQQRPQPRLGEAPMPPDEHGAPGALPRLPEMQRRTDAHSAAVGEALNSTNQ